jgi:hypothetical protein
MDAGIFEQIINNLMAGDELIELRMHFVNYDKNNTIMVKRMVWYPEQRSSM